MIQHIINLLACLVLAGVVGGSIWILIEGWIESGKELKRAQAIQEEFDKIFKGEDNVNND